METTFNPEVRWNFATKIAFRFFVVYFFLYIFPFPLDYIPGSDIIFSYYDEFWNAIVLWTAKNILNLNYEISVELSGSGDTTYDYVHLFIIFSVSLISCLAWTIIDKKQRDYDRLLLWLTVYLRYFLAFTLFSYAFAKIFKTQFPFPSPGRLLQPFGEASPMGLAWTFLGYSYAYNIFMGVAELVGGLLLLFRRTVTLGTIIVIGVMSNVVMMNFAYDIPVKLFSSHLLLMAFFLLIPDIKRVWYFFVANRPVPVVTHPPLLKSYRAKRVGIVFKLLLIGGVLFMRISQGLEAKKLWGDDAVKPPLYGVYNVQTFINNTDTLMPLTTDSVRWKRVSISWPGYARIRFMNDAETTYAFTPDTLSRTVAMYSFADTTKQYKLMYDDSIEGQLALQGKIEKDSVNIIMQRFDPKSCELVSRGFYWVNEYPYSK